MSELEGSFPERAKLRYANVVNAIKELDTVDNDGISENRITTSKISQKQGTFVYIRVYLNEKDETLVNGDVVTIEYQQDNEKFNTTFVSYGKDIGRKSEVDELVDYVPEDDRKVLCLMIDIDEINYNSDHIPFIRSLFKMGRFFEYQLFKYEELAIKSETKSFEFFDINFG